jgi:cobalamin-dependent methionine synthase I
MAYTNAQGRQQLLDAIASATDDVAVAIANLGEAYEQLDTSAADRLEDRLFRPLQTAYGQLQRLHGEFAGRYGLPTRAFEAAHPQVREHDAKGIIDRAAAYVERADAELATLQDSMLPIEVGDPPLRAGLEQVRMLLGDIGSRTREITRTLGR